MVQPKHEGSSVLGGRTRRQYSGLICTWLAPALIACWSACWLL